MIAVVIGLMFLGMALAVPLGFYLFWQIVKSKKEAEEIIKSGKIENMKTVDTLLKVLNAGKDQESRHLWNKLNELKSKQLNVS